MVSLNFNHFVQNYLISDFPDCFFTCVGFRWKNRRRRSLQEPTTGCNLTLWWRSSQSDLERSITRRKELFRSSTLPPTHCVKILCIFLTLLKLVLKIEFYHLLFGTSVNSLGFVHWLLINRWSSPEVIHVLEWASVSCNFTVLCLVPSSSDLLYCVLQEVLDKYTAVVKMIDSGDKLKLDQSHLETVIPAPGELWLWLKVHHSGSMPPPHCRH